MTQHTNAVREALSKALDDVGAPKYVGTDDRPATDVSRSYVVQAPKVESDPRFVQYGEDLLAACRTAEAKVDTKGFAAWRSEANIPDGTGVITQLRLYREHRRTKVLDLF